MSWLNDIFIPMGAILLVPVIVGYIVGKNNRVPPPHLR